MERRVLFSEEEIQERVRELARRISGDYRGQEIVLVALLKGAVPFQVDLGRELQRLSDQSDGVADVVSEYLDVTSYGDSQTPGELKIDRDTRRPVTGQHVLIVEDTADTCHTLDRVVKHLREQHPASLRVCVLVEKPDKREHDVEIHYVGFSRRGLPFLGGNGLDVKGKQRFTTDIFEVPPE